MKKNTNKLLNRDNSYFFKIGITAFLTVAAMILFFFFIFRIKSILTFVEKVLDILQPVIVGFVIAYLINPIFNFFTKLLSKAFKKRSGTEGIVKVLSIAIAVIIFLCIIALFFFIVVPAFSKSFSQLVQNIPAGFETIIAWIERFIYENEAIANALTDFVNSQRKLLSELITKNANSLAAAVASGVIDTVTFLVDFIIGIMVAVYVLASKNLFKRHTKKILCACFDENRVKTIIRGINKSDEVFGGFITGKLLNSLIIGILCFIGVSIMKIPYAPLITVVIAVTDIIPIFGPYIGTIPCAFLILLTDPLKCLYFVLFMILLQFIDGNLIGPKILGESTGLSAFWVILSIIIGGGLFGVLGMLIGVPVCAVIYYIIRALLNRALKNKNLPTDTLEYNSINSIYSKENTSDEQKPTPSAE